MRLRILALAVSAVAALATSPATADTEVRAVGDRVEVRAQGAPLAEVLDRLARQTGMKLVFEGPAPRARVSLALPAMPPAEAVLATLEGQGLTYAMRFDATGSRVEMLIVVAAGGASASAGGAAPPRPDLRGVEHEVVPEPDEEEPEPPPQAPRIDPDRMEREKEEGRQEPRRPPNFPFGPGGPTAPSGPGVQTVPFSPTGPAVPLMVPPPGGAPNPNVVGPRPVPSPAPQQ